MRQLRKLHISRVCASAELKPIKTPLFPSTTSSSKVQKDDEEGAMIRSPPLYISKIKIGSNQKRRPPLCSTNLQSIKSFYEQQHIPHNSSIPTTASSIISRIKQSIEIYGKLSKFRLATLVTLTTMAGYSISPSVCLIQSPNLLIYTTLGTSLCITAANTINQLMEIEHDSRMARTRNRLLASGALQREPAWWIACLSGVFGTAILADLVNPVTAMLGCGNILLYTCVYTPLKRRSVWNTHVGALVGAIPPLMGWTAVNGGYIVGESTGGLLLAGILFAWQFPHFNALSHNIRRDYLQAGYVMMANCDPVKNAAISLRWTAAMFPLCYGLVESAVVSDGFLLSSTVPNAAMLFCAWRFWRNQKKLKQSQLDNNTSRNSNDESFKKDKDARNLFLASLFHMPAIVLLALFHKRHWYSRTNTESDSNNTIQTNH